MSKPTLLTGPDAWATARRKAQYSDRDWIVWDDKDGNRYADVYSYATVKRAMLAVGTQGTFARFSARDRFPMQATWRLGALWLRNARIGY